MERQQGSPEEPGGLLHPPGHGLLGGNLPSSEADQAATARHETERSLGAALIFFHLCVDFSSVFQPVMMKIIQLKLV